MADFAFVLVTLFSECFLHVPGMKRNKEKFESGPICGYIGYHRSPFVYHMIQKHNDMSYGTVEMHKCDLCNFQSCYLPTVKKHKKTVHGKYLKKKRREIRRPQCFIKIIG